MKSDKIKENTLKTHVIYVFPSLKVIIDKKKKHLLHSVVFIQPATECWFVVREDDMFSFLFSILFSFTGQKHAIIKKKIVSIKN